MKFGCAPAAAAALLCVLFSSSASALQDDSAERIRALTDAFASASDRQDQAAMDDLLDPDVLFSGGSGQVDRDEQRDRNDDISALILAQTQAFRTALQRGDRAQMRRHADESLTFVDEDGTVATRASLRADTPALAPGCTFATLAIADWVLHHDADVAVSSFTLVRSFDCAGQAIDTRSLAVDIWRRRSTQWNMVGSQTIALHQDPPAISLAPEALADYVGDYSDGAGLTVHVSVGDKALATAVNGEKATPLAPESADVFFRPTAMPGYARRRVCFRRDRQGRVSEYASGSLVLRRVDAPAAAGAPAAPLPEIVPSLKLRDFVVRRAGNVALATFLHDRIANYHGHAVHATYRSMEAWVKRGDKWKMISSQGRELPADLPTIPQAPRPLTEYVGSYAVSPQHLVRISQVGDHLVATVGHGDGQVLLPVAEDRFLVAGQPRMSIIFRRNRSGCVTTLLDRRDEHDVRLMRQQIAGESLLAADRALAARSATVGFVSAYGGAMAPDARKLDADVPTAVGRDAILALMARYPADLELDWNPEEAVVARSGDLGYTWGHFIASHRDAKGETVTEFGRYLDVWRRDTDGLWRWIADIGTSGPKSH